MDEEQTADKTTRFIEALAYSYIHAANGLDATELLPGEDFPGARLLAEGQGGLVIIPGDGITEYQVLYQVNLLRDMLRGNVIPGKWNFLVILYVFESEPPRNLANLIPRAVYRTLVPTRFTGAGYVSLESGNLRILEDLQISGVLDIVRGVLRRHREGLLEDLAVYRTVFDLESRRNLAFLKRLATFPFVTWTLGILFVALFIWITFAGGTGKTMVMLRFGALSTSLIEQGEWWRLFGAMFLHIGFLHLVMNIFALVTFGSVLERFWGSVRFMALFALTGMVGSGAGFLSNALAAAGASGAVFGLLGAALITGYRYRNIIPSKLRDNLLAGMAATTMFNVAFVLIVPGIESAVLIGGLITGIVFALFLAPESLEQEANNEEEDEKSLHTVSTEGFRKRGLSPVAMIMLGLLALAPFIIEVYVAYRAAVLTSLAAFPMTEYRDPENRFSFQYPAFLRMNKTDGEQFLNSYEFSFHTTVVNIDKLTLTKITELKDVKTVEKIIKEELVQEFGEQYSLTIRDYDVRMVGNRRWLILDAVVFGPGHGRLDARFALTVRMNMLYRIEMYTTPDDLEDAENVLDLIIADFNPIFP